MSSVTIAPAGLALATVHAYGTELGATPWAQQMWSRARLPTESIGSMALTMTNVVAGSTYDVEVASSGAQVLSGTASASTVALSIPVYQAGSDSNTLRVKVRKASASPYYQVYETQVIAAIGSQSIFINQLTDE